LAACTGLLLTFTS